MNFNAKISLTDITSFLLVAVSLLGFSFGVHTAAASSAMNDTNTTIGNDAATGSSNTANDTNTIELAEEPFAVGHYVTVSENTINETYSQFIFEGDTTLTLPNSTTETIITSDTGQGNVTVLPGGGVAFIRGQLHMTTEDGSETATA